jgi:hypothetical protein
MGGKGMRRSKKIPDMSIYQASDYWDEHDFTEFEDTEEVKGVQFDLRKRKYIPVDRVLYEKISKKAKRLHITEDNLVNEWLKEKVG